MMTTARFRNTTDALPSMPSQHHLSSRNLQVVSNHDNNNHNNNDNNMDACYDKEPKPPLRHDNNDNDDDDSVVSDDEITTHSSSTATNHSTNGLDDNNSTRNSNSTQDYLTKSLLSLFRWGSNSNLSETKVKTKSKVKRDKKRKTKKDKQQKRGDTKNKQLHSIDHAKQSVSTPCLKVSSYHSSNSQSQSNHDDDDADMMDNSHTSHTSVGSISSFQLSRSPRKTKANTLSTTSTGGDNQRRRELLLQFKHCDSTQSSMMASHNTSIRSVSFRDKIQVHSVPDLAATTHRDDLYYSPREIVQMQHEKLQQDADLARQERDRIVQQRKAERQARRVQRQERLQARRATRVQQLQAQIQSQQQQQSQSCKALLQTTQNQEPTSNTSSTDGDNVKPQTTTRRQSLRKEDTPNKPPLSPHYGSRRQLHNQCKSTSHIMEGYGSLSVLDLGDDDDYYYDDDDKFDFEKKDTYNKKHPKSPTNGRRRSALSSSSAWHVSMSVLEDTTTITALMKKKDDNQNHKSTHENSHNNHDTPSTKPSYSYRPSPLTSTVDSFTTTSSRDNVTQDRQRSQSGRAIKVEESTRKNTKTSEIQWSPPPSFASPPTPRISTSKRFHSTATTKFIPPAPLHDVPLTPATSHEMEPPSPKDCDAESPHEDKNTTTTSSKRTTLKKALSLHSVKLSNTINNSDDEDEIQLVGSSSCRSLLSQYSADFKMVQDTNETKKQPEEQQQDFWAMIFGNHNPNIISYY